MCSIRLFTNFFVSCKDFGDDSTISQDTKHFPFNPPNLLPGSLAQALNEESMTLDIATIRVCHALGMLSGLRQTI